jgi:hypothetical protein
MSKVEIDLDDIVDLQSFLMGQPAERHGLQMSAKCQPKLTQLKANRVIWYLQEVLRVIPDTYEMCDKCGEVYDQDCSGHLGTKQEGTYCDDCDGP